MDADADTWTRRFNPALYDLIGVVRVLACRLELLRRLARMQAPSGPTLE